MRTFSTFEDAQEAATDDDAISGCFVNGTDELYWLTPRDASEADAFEISFEARYGRQMHDGERQMLAATLETMPEKLSATRDDFGKVPA